MLCTMSIMRWLKMARLVDNGSSQQLGGDFDETFSSVIKPATIHTVLSLAVSPLLQQIIDSLHNEFDMTDLRALNYFLGISADRNSTGLFLSQRKYDLQLLERAHMVHWAADFGLQLYASATTSLVGYTDADWAAKRQHTLSRSSAEAEYRGVANIVVETAWLRNLLRELHSPLSTTILVYSDNVRVLHMPSHFQYANIFTKGLPSALPNPPTNRSSGRVVPDEAVRAPEEAVRAPKEAVRAPEDAAQAHVEVVLVFEEVMLPHEEYMPVTEDDVSALDDDVPSREDDVSARKDDLSETEDLPKTEVAVAACDEAVAARVITFTVTEVSVRLDSEKVLISKSHDVLCKETALARDWVTMKETLLACWRTALDLKQKVLDREEKVLVREHDMIAREKLIGRDE
ncbi:ribonuclease H-like domain-containing protein [Tanacetum coccineum]